MPFSGINPPPQTYDLSLGVDIMEKIRSGLSLVTERLGSFSSLFDGFGQEFLCSIIEIRFSVGRPIQLVTQEEILFIGKNGKKLCSIKPADRLEQNDIKTIFSSVCEHSVHAFEREICEGFVTIEGGSRAGICGTAIYDRGKICAVKDISSVAIRISHEVKGAAQKLTETVAKEGLSGFLVAGAPCCGKTTVLRDFARALASGECGRFYRVSIVDERTELAGMFRGVPSFDIGITSDVLNGYIKSDGIITAVRALSHDIVVCDEFGGEEDISASLFAMKCGVKIAASVHAESISELLQKPSFKKLFSENVFSRIVFLDKPGEIKEIIDVKDVLI